jgi:tetratricopeptide (TPR) repeat protein
MTQNSDPSSLMLPVEPAPDDIWTKLVAAFLRHDRATPSLLANLIDNHPDDAIGPLVKGYMLLMLARRELRVGATDALAEGRRRLFLSPDPRAGHYASGLAAWLGGNPRGAIAAMERVIGDNPMDAMAVKISHAIRFMLGDADGMRRSLARVVSVYTENQPHAGFIKGCYAFALEETGEYEEAEKIGRKAVELEASDAWGRHAVAHVFEMTGRASEGLAWLSDEKQWDHCNNFAFHLHWHIGLFHLELGQASEALRLYDQAIRAERTDDFRDIANATSMLQRIELEGISVGNRWDELADLAEGRVADRQLVFADLHYLMALLGAGRFSSAETLVRGLLSASGDGLNGDLSSKIGAPLAAGLIAFRAGRMGEAVSLLEPIRQIMHQIGGSHAQRDVFEQIYVEALVRSGAAGAKPALTNRRSSRGGQNRFAERRLSLALGTSARGALAVEALSLTPMLQSH